jgi:hypothetical protein
MRPVRIVITRAWWPPSPRSVMRGSDSVRFDEDMRLVAVEMSMVDMSES